MFTIIGADGKEYGPVSADNINDWIAAGRANLQTQARRTGETEWKILGDFAEFVTPPILATSDQSEPQLTLVTPVPIAPAPGLNSASRWLRLGATILDGVICGMCIAPGLVILTMAGVFSTPNSPNAPLLFGGFAAIGAAMLLLVAFQIYLLITRGQTIGKKLLGIKIVNFDDEANPGFVKVIVLRGLVNGLLGMIPFVGMAYALVDILFIFRDDRRCIHDLLAGTKVVPVSPANVSAR